jgi:uncharacterized membrane protein YraQ (UPF0718 family)
MNNLVTTIQYFLIITAELTVLFIGISTIVSLILLYVPPEKIQNWLSKTKKSGNFLGAGLGSLTPFCACSTIPMTIGLLNAGVPFGSVISFLIASPLLNPVIISMIWVLMGFKACLIYFLVTFLCSVFFGIIMEKTGGQKYLKIMMFNKKHFMLR